MGASKFQIVSLITRNYLWLALIAACIAFTVAHYFMNNWLKIFSFNAGLSVVPFVVSAFFIVFTVVATATFHSAKAALSKPAENLRTE